MLLRSVFERCVVLCLAIVALGCSGSESAGPTEVHDGVFTVSFDSALVAGHSRIITITNTTHDTTPPTVVILDPEMAQFGACSSPNVCDRGAVKCRLIYSAHDCSYFDFRMTPLASGKVSMQITQGGGETPIQQGVVTLDIEAPRPVRLETFALDGRVLPKHPYRVAVRAYDQVGSVMHTLVPTATGSSGIVIDSVRSLSALDSISAVVWVHATRAGAGSVRVSADAVSSQTDLVLAAVADDSAHIVGANASIAVASNDADGISGLKIVRAPVHGSAVVSGTTIQFSAQASFAGVDSLRYSAIANGRTDTATVHLSVMQMRYVAGPLVSLTTDPRLLRINDSGDVTAIVTVGSTHRAIRWHGAAVDTLPSSSDVSRVVGIDNSGNVLGVVDGQAVRWRRNGSIEERVVPFDVPMTAIVSPWMSRGGTILLPQQGPSSSQDQYIVRGTRVDTIKLVLHFPVFAGINDAGDVIGNNADVMMYEPVFVHYAAGAEVSFALGGRGATPLAINNEGAVLASSRVGTNTTDTHMVVYKGGALTDITAKYGLPFGGGDMNDAESVVVQSFTGPYILFGGAVMPLQPLLVDQSLTVDGAYAINNAKQVLAQVHGTDGVKKYVVLTPAP